MSTSWGEVFVTNMSGLLAYFGHHKCATQWLNRMVANICEITDRTRVRYTNPSEFDSDLASAITDPERTFLCYTNADIDFVHCLEGMLGFHVVRDPRDIVVSAYFSHLFSHPGYGDLATYRDELKSLSKDEGLLLEMSRRNHQFDAMLRWDYEQPHVLELRMEALITDTLPLLAEIVRFLGIEDEVGGEATLARIVECNTFEAITGRLAGDEDVTSHYRKGIAGDWREHFGDDHVACFKENYGQLVLKLGYETSTKWD